MQSQQIYPANGFTLGLAATVPTFLVLSLNGTALFYGIGTVLSLSIIVGLTATLASFAGKKTKKNKTPCGSERRGPKVVESD